LNNKSQDFLRQMFDVFDATYRYDKIFCEFSLLLPCTVLLQKSTFVWRETVIMLRYYNNIKGVRRIFYFDFTMVFPAWRPHRISQWKEANRHSRTNGKTTAITRSNSVIASVATTCCGRGARKTWRRWTRSWRGVPTTISDGTMRDNRT